MGKDAYSHAEWLLQKLKEELLNNHPIQAYQHAESLQWYLVNKCDIKTKE